MNISSANVANWILFGSDVTITSCIGEISNFDRVWTELRVDSGYHLSCFLINTEFCFSFFH